MLKIQGIKVTGNVSVNRVWDSWLNSPSYYKAYFCLCSTGDVISSASEQTKNINTTPQSFTFSLYGNDTSNTLAGNLGAEVLNDKLYYLGYEEGSPVPNNLGIVATYTGVNIHLTYHSKEFNYVDKYIVIKEPGSSK